MTAGKADADVAPHPDRRRERRDDEDEKTDRHLVQRRGWAPRAGERNHDLRAFRRGERGSSNPSRLTHSDAVATRRHYTTSCRV